MCLASLPECNVFQVHLCPGGMCQSLVPFLGCYAALWVGHRYVPTHHSWTCGLFPPVPVGNNTAVDTRVQIFAWTCVFSSLGRLPRSGIAGSHGSSSSNFLRHCHTGLHIGRPILHPCQQCGWLPVSPHSCPHLLLSDFDSNHPCAGAVAPPCGCGFCFPSSECCWASFHC